MGWNHDLWVAQLSNPQRCAHSVMPNGTFQRPCGGGGLPTPRVSCPGWRSPNAVRWSADDPHVLALRLRVGSRRGRANCRRSHGRVPGRAAHAVIAASFRALICLRVARYSARTCHVHLDAALDDPREVVELTVQRRDDGGVWVDAFAGRLVHSRRARGGGQATTGRRRAAERSRRGDPERLWAFRVGHDARVVEDGGGGEPDVAVVVERGCEGAVLVDPVRGNGCFRIGVDLGDPGFPQASDQTANDSLTWAMTAGNVLSNAWSRLAHSSTPTSWTPPRSRLTSWARRCDCSAASRNSAGSTSSPAANLAAMADGVTGLGSFAAAASASTHAP